MRDLLGSIADAMSKQLVGQAIKTEVDLERYQRVIDSTRPDLVVECGTFQGGSALWFADHAGCRVVTVDVNPLVPFDMWRSWGNRVTPFVGSSTDPNVVSAVTEAAAGHERVMVVLDSDHSAAHVRDEIAAYHGLVAPGCYMVVEDTLVRHMPWFRYEGSPMDAVEEFMEGNAGWENDLELEDLSPTTQHPGGWLRRRLRCPDSDPCWMEASHPPGSPRRDCGERGCARGRPS